MCICLNANSQRYGKYDKIIYDKARGFFYPKKNYMASIFLGRAMSYVTFSYSFLNFDWLVHFNV